MGCRSSASLALWACVVWACVTTAAVRAAPRSGPADLLLESPQRESVPPAALATPHGSAGNATAVLPVTPPLPASGSDDDLFDIPLLPTSGTVDDFLDVPMHTAAQPDDGELDAISRLDEAERKSSSKAKKQRKHKKYYADEDQDVDDLSKPKKESKSKRKHKSRKQQDDSLDLHATALIKSDEERKPEESRASAPLLPEGGDPFPLTGEAEVAKKPVVATEELAVATEEPVVPKDQDRKDDRNSDDSQDRKDDGQDRKDERNSEDGQDLRQEVDPKKDSEAQEGSRAGKEGAADGQVSAAVVAVPPVAAKSTQSQLGVNDPGVEPAVFYYNSAPVAPATPAAKAPASAGSPQWQQQGWQGWQGSQGSQGSQGTVRAPVPATSLGAFGATPPGQVPALPAGSSGPTPAGWSLAAPRPTRDQIISRYLHDVYGFANTKTLMESIKAGQTPPPREQEGVRINFQVSGNRPAVAVGAAQAVASKPRPIYFITIDGKQVPVYDTVENAFGGKPAAMPIYFITINGRQTPVYGNAEDAFERLEQLQAQQVRQVLVNDILQHHQQQQQQQGQLYHLQAAQASSPVVVSAPAERLVAVPVPTVLRTLGGGLLQPVDASTTIVSLPRGLAGGSATWLQLTPSAQGVYGAAASGPASGYGAAASGPASGYGAAASGPASGYGAAASGPASGYGAAASGPASGYGAAASGPASGYGAAASGPASGYGAGTAAPMASVTTSTSSSSSDLVFPIAPGVLKRLPLGSPTILQPTEQPPAASANGMQPYVVSVYASTKP